MIYPVVYKWEEKLIEEKMNSKSSWWVTRNWYSVKILWKNETNQISNDLGQTQKDIRSSKDDLIILYWEFDPGSGWTLAACLTHASRTEFYGMRLRSNEVKLSGGRVSNVWATCLSEGDNAEKSALIPHDMFGSHDLNIKGAIRWKMGSHLIR